MSVKNDILSKWRMRVVFLSLLLIFFTIPHTLEDFVTGEPIKADIPAPFLALVISIIFSLQAIGLFWLGLKQKRGLALHVGIGLFWPVASGFVQLPTILSGTTYRSGAISIFYVIGMIIVGILLCLASLFSLKISSSSKTS